MSILKRVIATISVSLCTGAFAVPSYIVADGNGAILDEKHSNVVRPIASITKLMLGSLVSSQDLTEELTIPKLRTVSSKIPRKQLMMSRRDLLLLSLVKSDNFASQILCENLPNCVMQMNAKARSLDMLDTEFVEPTGLSKQNVSTAGDLLKLLMAVSSDTILSEFSSSPKARVSSGKLTVSNTNPLTSKLNVLMSKTGFTNPAGGCIVMIVQSPVGQRILVLLGSRNTKTRIPEIEKLYHRSE